MVESVDGPGIWGAWPLVLDSGIKVDAVCGDDGMVVVV